MTRLCPTCNVELTSEDRFCEDCGSRLEVPQPPPSDCARCGAGPGTVDSDGYCEACGLRRVASKRDHVEAAVAPGFEGISDRGMRHHNNEDALAMDTVAGDAHIIVICDGVSSTDGADQASEAAAEAAFRSLVQSIESGHETRRTAMLAAIGRAAAAVTSLASAHRVPATTIIAAVARGAFVDIAWLGDSRAYWIGPEGPALQLTEDHVDFPGSHAITRWLGADAPEDQAPSTSRFNVPGPGWLLLCSDGLWNYLPDPAEMVRGAGSVEALVNFANEAGGHDNITAVLLRIPLPSREQEEPVTS